MKATTNDDGGYNQFRVERWRLPTHCRSLVEVWGPQGHVRASERAARGSSGWVWEGEERLDDMSRWLSSG